MKRIILSLALLFALSPLAPVQAGDGVLYIAADRLEGYDRKLFKHWIDADKNGCDTRKEVLIAEAIVKPKIGKKCVLTGGKWISSFDGKSHTRDSGLDVDHLVPLAEAWRSGAWAWTDKERENYANFIEQEWMLNAVTASVNRSKSDRDIANWLPTKNVCEYLRGWVIVKTYFNLTVDAAEAKIIDKNYSTCGLGTVTKQSSTQTPTVQHQILINSFQWSWQFTYLDAGSDAKVIGTSEKSPTMVIPLGERVRFTIDSSDVVHGLWIPEFMIQIEAKPGVKSTLEFTADKLGDFQGRCNILCGRDHSQMLFTVRVVAPSEYRTYIANLKVDKVEAKPTTSATPTSAATPTPTPSAQTLVVTPGAFCSPAGATGKSSKGVAYTCKTSPTDTKNRWRQ
jgi:heme/copper-type cytochrome/quinol oxidase subunit 2